MSLSPPAPNNILKMDKENLREIDGVVLDLDSYARHSAADSAPQPAAADDRSASPPPVFAAPPVHAGWYEAAQPGLRAYPIMAGAVAAAHREEMASGMLHTGSGSGSYPSSLMTSYHTSWLSSYWYGSGSGLYSSGAFGSGTPFLGGFGLELI